MSKKKPKNGQTPNTSPKDDKAAKKKDATPQDKKVEKPSEDNTQNNPLVDSPKKLTVKELFNMSIALSGDLSSSFDEIKDIDSLIVLTDQKIKSLTKDLENHRRYEKRLGKLGKKPSGLTVEDKKLIKLEISTRNTQLFNLREKRDTIRARFNSHFSSERAAQEYALLRSKAESRTYVVKNRIFLCRKAETILNNALQGEYRAEVVELKRIASGDSEDNIKVFNSNFRDLLDKIDFDAAIILSGAIREKLYTAIRNSLIEWDSSTNTIPELELPTDNE